jgi:hypothetical protein
MNNQPPAPPTHYLVPSEDLQKIGEILRSAPYVFAHPVIQMLDRAQGCTVTPTPAGQVNELAGKIVTAPEAEPLADSNGTGVGL